MKKIVLTTLLGFVCTAVFAGESLEQFSQRVQELEKTVKVLNDANYKNECGNTTLQNQYVLGKTMDNVEQEQQSFNLVGYLTAFEGVDGEFFNLL